MKKLLIISIVFLFGGFALAQNESAVGNENSVLVNAPEFSVVRNWQNTFTISSRGKYLVKDTLGMISASTGTVPYYSALITDSIPNLHINDMKFVDNYAFICGYIIVSGSNMRGVLGYFNLNDFYAYNTLQIKLHVYDNIREFSKMVAYHDVTGYKVVAIGTYIWGSLYPSCVVEGNVLNPIIPNNFRYVPFSSASYPREYLTDLVLINDSVYFVGYLYDALTPGYPYNTLCIRTADKHDVINTFSGCNQYDTGFNEVNGRVHAAKLKEGLFAVSYVYKNKTTGAFYTRIRTFDINTLNMVYSQEFQTYQKDEPIEMAYDANNNILTLLHPMPFKNQHSYFQSYFVQADPLATLSYYAPVLSPKIGLFSSIDMFSNVYYVSTGENHWYYQHTTAPQPNLNYCPEMDRILVKPISNIDKHIGASSNVMSSVVNTDIRIVNINPITIDLQCDDN